MVDKYWLLELVSRRNQKGETARHLAATQMDSTGQKALYLLHAVGAMRCTTQDFEILQNCTGGCHSSGQENGVVPPEAKCYPVRF